MPSHLRPVLVEADPRRPVEGSDEVILGQRTGRRRRRPVAARCDAVVQRIDGHDAGIIERARGACIDGVLGCLQRRRIELGEVAGPAAVAALAPGRWVDGWGGARGGERLPAHRPQQVTSQYYSLVALIEEDRTAVAQLRLKRQLANDAVNPVVCGRGHRELQAGGCGRAPQPLP